MMGCRLHIQGLRLNHGIMLTISATTRRDDGRDDGAQTINKNAGSINFAPRRIKGCYQCSRVGKLDYRCNRGNKRRDND